MSHFPVICMLQSMTATHITEYIKAIFSEYGVSKSIVTDNGPCYSSEYFKEMMKNMRIIKSLLQKAKETGDDPHAMIFIYHSTPLSDTLSLPFEMPHNQKPISDLPQNQYNPTITSDTLHLKGKYQEKQMKTSSP